MILNMFAIQKTTIPTTSNLRGGSSLLVQEKGEKGEKGDVGPRGRKGKQGPKVLCWSKNIEIDTEEVSTLITFPHEDNEYAISKFDIVVQGTGAVDFFLVDDQSGEKLASVNTNLEDNLSVISHEDIAKPVSSPAIISLQAVSVNNDEPIKLLSFTVTLNQN